MTAYDNILRNIGVRFVQSNLTKEHIDDGDESNFVLNPYPKLEFTRILIEIQLKSLIAEQKIVYLSVQNTSCPC